MGQIKWEDGKIREYRQSELYPAKNEYNKGEYLEDGDGYISYEDLYYNNGFEKIINYLNMENIKNIGFPVGNKYRIYVNKTNTLI